MEISSNLEDAKQVADTPAPGAADTSAPGVVSPASLTSFWHNSFIETVWDWYYGSGWHVHLSPTDTSFVTNLGWVAVDTLAAALVATGVITMGAGVVVGAMLTIAVITTSWALQNDDGSIDLTAYKNNIYESTCVKLGQYLGQAISKGTFRNIHGTHHILIVYKSLILHFVCHVFRFFNKGPGRVFLSVWSFVRHPAFESELADRSQAPGTILHIPLIMSLPDGPKKKQPATLWMAGASKMG